MSELIEFKLIDLNSVDYLIEKQLREDMLRKPLGMILSHEDLCYDHLFTHAGAFIQGHLIGCLIWQNINEGCVQIKQVCIRNAYQGRQIGSSLMKYAEQEIRKAGNQEIMLHARCNAWTFYQRLGYHFTSDEFKEVGIIHREMRKYLQKKTEMALSCFRFFLF